MNDQKIIKILLGSILIVLLIGVIGIFQKPIRQPLGGADYNIIEGTLSNTAVTVATTSTAIVSGNVGRIYAAFINDSDEAIYLGLGEAAVMNEGIRLNASGGSYEITPDNLFTGAVYGICTSGSKVLTVVEK